MIGTRSAEIFNGKLNSGNNPEKLFECHYEGELWGCATDPKAAKFVTCGGDRTIRTWDISQKKMLNSTEPLPNDVRSVDWSPLTGSMIVAGDSIG